MSGDDSTRQTSLPTPTPTSDEQATRAVEQTGVVAELKATFQSGERKTLPLYGMPDQIVVGRGTASDWQLDDTSLSRKHCQLRWNGRELTVEDLGSANGTRVGARAALSPTPVKPGDSIQLGTVIVSFELKGAHPPLGGDAESTRLVSAPAGDVGTTGSIKTPAAFIAAPTVVRKYDAPPAPKPNAAVFRPERDAARPDEPTRPWDPNAALVHPPEKAIDASELMERLKAAWRTNRRPFVMAGAALWILILLGVWQIATRPPPEEDTFGQPPPRQRVDATDVKPRETADPTRNTGTGQNTPPPLDVDDGDRDDQLAQAVAAYDQGRMSDALAYFRKLAADPKDVGARFMVELIESRTGGSPPPAPSPGGTP